RPPELFRREAARPSGSPSSPTPPVTAHPRLRNRTGHVLRARQPPSSAGFWGRRRAGASSGQAGGGETPWSYNKGKHTHSVPSRPAPGAAAAAGAGPPAPSAPSKPTPPGAGPRAGGRDREQALLLLLLLSPWMLPALRTASRRLLSMAAAEPPAPGSLSAAFITCPNEKVAKEIARAMVEKRLAACVNVVPQITSIYMWKGQIEEDAEVLLVSEEHQLVAVPVLRPPPPPRQCRLPLPSSPTSVVILRWSCMVKTRSSRIPALAEFVRSVHPYEVAEVIAVPIQQGNAPYLRWVEESVPE
ncbi:hypothetical protein lerEdw1_015913, partial [Lerista edwardsae]